jgi:DNA-binding transcriptional regulator GbsR (MarR family)
LFDIPKKKPRIELKEKKEDARFYSVVPLRAIHDKRLTRGDLINLISLCSYCSNNGFTFVAHSTIAALRGCSVPNVSRGLKKLERLGYFEQVKKGYTGIRGSLKRVVFDNSLSIEDVISISNTPIEQPTQEAQIMARYKRTTQANNNQADTNTRITFQEAMLVVSHSLKSDSDLLTLERIVSQGISKGELLKRLSEGTLFS